MENLNFEKFDMTQEKEVMDIFNYYVKNSFAAYPEKQLPYEFFGKMIEMTKGYPAYVMKVNEKIIGFCFIRAYNPFPAFSETAEITYFIDKDYSGKGFGKMALEKLEGEAQKLGIKTILASITSENVDSLKFHRKNGFAECGKFPAIGNKFGKPFDIIWMFKKIANG